MEKEQYTTKNGAIQYRQVMKESEYVELWNDGGNGFCLACGSHADDHVEPDARRYPCASCRQPKVYGLEELLLMGLVRLTN